MPFPLLSDEVVSMRRSMLLLLFTLPAWIAPVPSGPEDESVFVKNLRPDQHESLLYVWTSDADAKQPDFLPVVDADPKSPRYGKTIRTVPTGSPVDNEAPHCGYTVNADRIFAGGLVSNRLFIYDVKTDPLHPKLIKTVPDLGALSGYTGPHTYYAVPGGVMIAMLGSKDGTGPGALIRLDEQGNFVSALPAPNRPDDPGYMYDVGVKPELNRMVTSSWTHPHHFRGNPIAPADVRISYDNRLLYVSLFSGNAVQQYDVSDPLHPKFVSEVKLQEPNMMKLTPDSRRLYVSNSLLSNLDGKVPFRVWLLDVDASGMKLNDKFAVDFDQFPTGPGRPHDMLLK